MKVKRLFSSDGGIVQIGEECTVYSILLWDNKLSYLLCGGPYWYFSEQFKIIENSIPPIWHFNFRNYKNQDGIISNMAIWGYKEMVVEQNHYIDLIERNQDSLDIFYKRKEEIDEFEETINKS